MPIITLPENNKKLSVPAGTNLLNALKENGIYPDAPCGGNGTCGKCTMLVNGKQVLACKTVDVRQVDTAELQSALKNLGAYLPNAK